MPVDPAASEEPQPANEEKREVPSLFGAYLAIGVGVGAAIGVGIDNLALGMGIGLAFGVAMGLVIDRARVRTNRAKPENDDHAP